MGTPRGIEAKFPVAAMAWRGAPPVRRARSFFTRNHVSIYERVQTTLTDAEVMVYGATKGVAPAKGAWTPVARWRRPRPRRLGPGGGHPPNRPGLAATTVCGKNPKKYFPKCLMWECKVSRKISRLARVVDRV